jgi:hypothetical protein
MIFIQDFQVLLFNMVLYSIQWQAEPWQLVMLICYDNKPAMQIIKI